MSPLLAFGMNHKTAPLSVRERLALTPEKTIEALQHLKNEPLVEEAAILSTCNRTEIYVHTEQPFAVAEWLAEHQQFKLSEFETCCYYYQDKEAVKHMMRVACGLDSMILGEPQIFGQMKQAFQHAHTAGTLGFQLQNLFQTIFSVSKNVRHQTHIGENSISLAYTIAKMAQKIFTRLPEQKILFIGAGETIELIATHFYGMGCRNIVIANRTLKNAENLAKNMQAEMILLSNIPNRLKEMDIVISATDSDLPLLGKGTVENALKQRKRRPMLMVDLAVPRDIEPEIAALEDVYLYNIEDLQNLITQNYQTRTEAAAEAESMIELQATHYLQQIKIHAVGDLIQQYRSETTALCDAELVRALQQLQSGRDPALVLHEFAHRFINKTLHRPTENLRKAAYEGKLGELQWFKRWFLE